MSLNTRQFNIARPIRRFSSLALLLILSPQLLAQESTTDKLSSALADVLDNNWKVTGFLTLGYTQTDKYDDRLFRRNITQEGIRLADNGFLVDSRLGLQLSGELSDHWEVAFQGVYKHQYATEWDDYIDVAFARYRASNEWQFTLGRQPFDLFILSDHINVGYSYDFVRPPTEFYGSIPYESFDGISISRHWGDFDNEWSWDLSIGFIEEEFETDAFDENDPDDTDDPGDDITRAEPIYNTAINWRSGNWHVRANYAWLKFEQELDDAKELEEFVEVFSPLWPDLSRIQSDFIASTVMRYASAGAVWQSGNWKIQSEISNIDADFVHFNGIRAYFHVSHRFGDWLPYATFGYARDNSKNDYQQVSELGLPDDFIFLDLFKDLEKEINEEVTSVRHNQRSLALGVRWDFSSRKALKMQCDYYKFDAASGSIHGRVDQLYANNESRSWCSLNLDMVF